MNKSISIVFGLGVTFIVGAVIYYGAEATQAQATVDQSDPKVIARGQADYEKFCASCHGKNLEGQPDWQTTKADGTLPAPPHDKDGHTWHHDDGILFAYTKGGGESLGLKGFKSGMPPFKSMLNDEKIWSILAYIKSTWPEKHRARQALATQQVNQQAQN